jgi:Fic family protein
MAGWYVGGPEGSRAFVPAPLPPSLTWTPELVRSLSDADRAVGRLAGEGRRLPNPHLLIRPFVRREAVLSSRIEGTQATLGELLAVEAGASVERSPADLREVANYVIALEYGVDRLKTLPLSLRLVREIHARLMEGVRGEQSTPGDFRRIQNWIGPAGCTPTTATYTPPPPSEMMEALNDLEGFLHDTSLPPLVQAALIHYQFEAIHPFLDGNGRAGRLLITLFLLERQILPSPLLYLSAFFEATRQEYYARLRGVTENNEWEAWVAYFLVGIARQAEDALGRAGRINHLLDRWRQAVAGTSQTATTLVDLLGENPYWTVTGLASRLSVAYTTAQRAVQRLEEQSVLFPLTDAKRNRVYCASAILEILEEPAQITG